MDCRASVKSVICKEKAENRIQLISTVLSFLNTKSYQE